MDTKVVHITIALEIDIDADPQEVVSELEYDITHPDIVSSEIRELEYDDENQEEECFAICPNCKTKHNLTHMMWTTIDCTECGYEIENKLIDEEE